MEELDTVRDGVGKVMINRVLDTDIRYTLSKLLPYSLGIAIVLSFIHYAGPVIPSLGYTVMILTVGFGLVCWYGNWRAILKSRLTWLVLTLTLLVSIQVVLRDTESRSLVIFLLSVLVYVTAMKFGNEARKLFLPAVIVLAMSIVAMAFIRQDKTGGWIDNYNMGAGVLLVFSTLVIDKHRWTALSIATVALFFTGAEEALISLTVMSIIVVATDGWGKLLYIILPLVVAIGISGSTGLLQKQYSTISTYLFGTVGLDNKLDNMTDGRWHTYVSVIKNVTFFGHGYQPILFEGSSTTDSAILTVLNQLGIIGCILYLMLMSWGLWCRRTRYMFTALLSYGLIDHTAWTITLPLTFYASGLLGEQYVR